MGVDASARARTLGVSTIFENLRPNGATLLPLALGVIGQGATASTYPLEKTQVFSAVEAGNLYGFGSPIYTAVKQLLPSNGDGVGSIPVMVLPLEDAAGAVAATGQVSISGTATAQGTVQVLLNNIRSDGVLVNVGDDAATVATAIAAAVQTNLTLPATAVPTAGDIDLTAKWAGESSNDIAITIEGEVAGITFAATPFSGGTLNPDVDNALALVGEQWITHMVNCLNADDSTTLDKYATWNEGRWIGTVRKPALVFTGFTGSQAASTAITSVRGSDRTNGLLNAPSCPDGALAVGARILARIAVVANNNPARDYGSIGVTGLTPGPDSAQWSYAERDSALKAGSSSSVVRDGQIKISDTVTCYAPVGDPDPAYRYACDVVKVFNVLYSLNLIFETPEWDGAPLLPDEQPSANPDAKKPRMARAAVASMIDGLALQAILADPATAKQTIRAQISASNPKRLDIDFTVQIAGNTNIISIDFRFGFFFGQLTPLV